MPAAASLVERDRRLIVRLVLCAFWLLIFEGALRKWVAPQFSQYLYFVRDPLTLCIYYVAGRAGVFRAPSAFLPVGLVIAALGALLALVHVVGGGQYTPLLAAYGVRNYFFYIPLAFVIGRCFGPDDVVLLGKQCLIAMLIAAPIAVLQFNAAGDSALNVGRATEKSLQFDNLVSAGTRVRPAGTFTSVVGMSQLIVCCVAWLMWAWTTPQARQALGRWLVILATVATAAALAVSGSRTSFVHSVLVVGVGVALGPLLPGASAKVRSIAIPAVLVVAFAALFPVLMPEAFEAFTYRWTTAATAEADLGLIGRALHGYYDFFRLFGDIPVLGYGVGMAGNAATMSDVTIGGVNVLRVAEEDWSRHVVELGPPLALLFIMYRASLGASLGIQSLRTALRTGNSLPVLLYAFVAVALIHGQITGHGLVNGFGWLFTGVCLAAVRSAVVHPAASIAPDAQPAAVAVPFPNLMR
jgi:hypothetical protein